MGRGKGSIIFIYVRSGADAFMNRLDDTIGAISTPPGKGGIGVLRLSGARSFEVTDLIFRGGIQPSRARSHSAHYGVCARPGTGEILDEVMIIVFRAPHTYTREDIVEIHTHGNMRIMHSILDELYALGVRPADPGEFTMRAYMNGRLDLTQAEAVADLVDAETDEAVRSALRQVSGDLQREIRQLRQRLIESYALYEAEIDFYEEDIELVDRDKSYGEIREVAESVSRLIDSFRLGRMIREGATIGLFGAVNAGKSSLFNAIIGKDRAIVHDEPGTTRDVVEMSVPVDGILCRFIDTAGFRDGTGSVESEGIRRSTAAMDDVDLGLLVLDGAEPLPENERMIYRSLRERLGDAGRIIVIENKIDIRDARRSGDGEDFGGSVMLHVSALKKWGIEEIRKAISDSLHSGGQAVTSGLMITNGRHHHLLVSAQRVLERIGESILKGVSGEFLALDFKEAIDYLGGITGEAIGEQVLESIFSKFCIGK